MAHFDTFKKYFRPKKTKTGYIATVAARGRSQGHYRLAGRAIAVTDARAPKL